MDVPDRGILAAAGGQCSSGENSMKYAEMELFSAKFPTICYKICVLVFDFQRDIVKFMDTTEFTEIDLL